MEVVVFQADPCFRRKVASDTIFGPHNTTAAMMPQFLSVFSLFLLSLKTTAGCLQCDGRFLDSVATLMKETLPEDVPNRYALIERHVQALADLHGTFLRKKYERVLDVRGVMALKSDIISRLREINNSTWKGVFVWQLSMYQLRVSLQNRMQQTLEKFADFGTNPTGKDRQTRRLSSHHTLLVRKTVGFWLSALMFFLLVAMTEGPVLDCWTCLRIVVQCFDGELCGVEDKRLAEYNEVVLYIFLVCESVVLSSAVLM
ncbi:hypothetical protein JD844_001399 [Phrynosoma platyrhinos]|uniref:Izumo sperm-egg fusion protein 3 n=1 Tax=Phrynosoma platyrhinos TaxID=52577 RepID=A0ABQ7T9Z2_PHRPL|nr:hypothetical protein JD844_001399 [Phrynosoma platyrhinos]